jgi:hypothetical protein
MDELNTSKLGGWLGLSESAQRSLEALKQAQNEYQAKHKQQLERDKLGPEVGLGRELERPGLAAPSWVGMVNEIVRGHIRQMLDLPPDPQGFDTRHKREEVIPHLVGPKGGGGN